MQPVIALLTEPYKRETLIHAAVLLDKDDPALDEKLADITHIRDTVLNYPDDHANYRVVEEALTERGYTLIPFAELEEGRALSALPWVTARPAEVGGRSDR